MKFQFTITALLFLAISSGSAQLASSHGSSAGAPPMKTPAAAPVSLQVTDKPVVKVNGTVLTDRDLLREMFAMFPYAQMHNGFPKGQEAEIRRGALQMIIFEELVYQEALRRKMTIAPERILREEKKFQQQFDSREKFDEYLKAELGGSEAKLRQQIKRSLLIQAVLKNEVEVKSAVTVKDARLYYEKNTKQFEQGEVFTIQTISIIPPANANADVLKEARKRADATYQQAKATKNYEEFGLLAEKGSDDDYRVNMGDHKKVTRENLPPEVVKVVLAMKAGQVSNLIQLGTAYTIVRLNTHTLPGKKSFAVVKGELMSNLQKGKYEQLRIAFNKKLHADAQIQEL